MVAHRLGQDEAYFTVREILAEASTAADGVLWREPSDFCRSRSGNVRVNPVAQPLTQPGPYDTQFSDLLTALFADTPGSPGRAYSES